MWVNTDLSISAVPIPHSAPSSLLTVFFSLLLQLSSHRSSSFYPLSSILIVRPLPSGVVALRFAVTLSPRYSKLNCCSLLTVFLFSFSVPVSVSVCS